jgi:outer membrane protein assembly factor BamB
MHRTMTRAFIFILLVFGSSEAQNPQKKLPAKGVATKLPTKGAITSKPLPPPSSSGWTQWGGPYRNFTSDSKGLANSWPATGPRKLWSRPLGDGYSGIAVDGGTLYTMYRRAATFWQIGKVDQEVVTALEATTGKTLWEFGYDASHLKGTDMHPGPGPDSMPMLIGDRLYAVGVTGKLHCLDKRTGKVLWSHDLYEEFHGTVLTYGYSCQPLAYKNTLILMVGGRGHALTAFNQNDGSVVWQKQDFTNSNSSPVLINVDGQDQVVAFMASNIIGVDPNNGDLFWSHPHSTQYGLAISMPVWGPDNLLFFSSSYDGGSRVLHLSQTANKTNVQELWRNNRVRIHFGSIIRIGDTVYGSSGHDGPCLMTAVEVKTGKVLWQTRDFAKASFLLADGQFIIVDEDGNIGLATPSPQGLTVHSKVPLLTNNTWTIPTLVGTKLYVRDRKTIMALDVGQS